MLFRAISSANVALFAAALTLVACSGSRSETEPAKVERSAEMEIAAAATLDSEDLAARFLEATQRYLGTPYENGPLGEGDGLDPDPRVDFTKADCVTYLEQSLALALAAPDPEVRFLKTLDAIRYREGRVGFAERNHYMVADWIPANEWLLEDVTAIVGPTVAKPVRRTIDRATFLREQGAEPREGVDDPREIEVRIIPTEELATVAPNLKSADLIFWVGKRDGIFVVHTGLAVQGEGGELLFRHASSKAGHALDESFADYAARASFAAGFLVLRLREEPLPPAAPSSG